MKTKFLAGPCAKIRFGSNSRGSDAKFSWSHTRSMRKTVNRNRKRPD